MIPKCWKAFSSVQSLSRVWLFATPWIAAHQASLSVTNSWSSHKLMSIELVMPSSHLILCCPLFLLPLIPPSIRVFTNESTLCMRWLKYWSFSLSISPSNEPQDWSPLGWTGWISLQSKGLARVFSSTTVQKHQSSVLSFLHSRTLTSIYSGQGKRKRKKNREQGSDYNGTGDLKRSLEIYRQRDITEAFWTRCWHMIRRLCYA